MNQVQKIGLFVGTALAGVLMVLHAPWSGYVVEGKPLIFAGTVIPASSLPFSVWYTTGPLFPWFGALSNFLWCLGAVVALSAFFVWLFKSPR